MKVRKILKGIGKATKRASKEFSGTPLARASRGKKTRGFI